MSTGLLPSWCQTWIGGCGSAVRYLWIWWVGEPRSAASTPVRPLPSAAPQLALQPSAKSSPRRPRWYSPSPAETLVHFAEDPPRHIPVIPIETSFEWEILGARTAVRLSALLPVFLEPLVDHPNLVFDNEWSPRARLGRAYRAGVSAARVCRGAFHRQAKSPSIPFDNFIYVVLQCRAFPEGFCTTSFALYIELVTEDGADFDPTSVSHSFPTCVETIAFLQGAQRQWPLELRLWEEN